MEIELIQAVWSLASRGTSDLPVRLAKESRELLRTPQVRNKNQLKAMSAPLERVTKLNSQELLLQYQEGKSEAATAIFDRYVARLIALARSRISPKLRRRVDAEDIVQSAYRSFFVHALGDEYQLTQSGDLWRLLASITLNKLYGQIEKQTAAKRDPDREQMCDKLIAEAKAPEPTAAEVIGLVEEFHLIINSLSADEQLTLTSRLQGKSIEEISNLLNKSERTVRRLLLTAKRKIEQRLLVDKSAPPKQPISAAPDAPLLYSDYVLEQLLGSGGMGKVFRAREKSTGKLVAIKALHKPRQSDERAVSQFAQEAQILAKLRHPNIVGVQGLGQFPSGGYFMVMDFVDGVDLQSRLNREPFSLAEVTSIGMQVVDAVSHAHSHGIVHCDLKPGNILLDQNGQSFVTDFGFAFLIANDSTAKANTIGGTTGYIAPEILRHESQPTPAVDIYALGMLLWVLATGDSPSKPNALRQATDQFTTLNRICQRCLAENPGSRYPVVDEIARALAASL